MSKLERGTKPFLKIHSEAFVALKKVVMATSLLKDLKHLTSFSHTGTLEVYHSLYNKFCPKRLYFCYRGMIFNAGVGLSQAKTKDGNLRYKQRFSKVTKSWVVKKIVPKKINSIWII